MTTHKNDAPRFVQQPDEHGRHTCDGCAMGILFAADAWDCSCGARTCCGGERGERRISWFHKETWNHDIIGTARCCGRSSAPVVALESSP